MAASQLLWPLQVPAQQLALHITAGWEAGLHLMCWIGATATASTSLTAEMEGEADPHGTLTGTRVSCRASDTVKQHAAGYWRSCSSAAVPRLQHLGLHTVRRCQWSCTAREAGS
jgi:hypothetical protein